MIETEKKEKQVIVNEMAKDLGLETMGYMEYWQFELIDKLIRAGWRKNLHDQR